MAAARRAARIATCLLVLQLGACLSDGQGPQRPRVVPGHLDGECTTWWADDRVREEGTYVDGRRDGHVRGYHPDGSLAFEGDFRDGVPVGELVQHHPGGARAIVSRIEGGLLEGERIEYDQAGVERSRMTMVAGRRHGEARTFHANGQPATHGRYEQDVPVGEWESFDETGRLTARTVYWSVDGQAAGYLESLQDPAGRVTVQTRMLLEDGDFVGRVTMWHGNGRQAGLVEYRNGLREGRDIIWDTAGRKRSEGRRTADQREGVWTTWDEAGALVSQLPYEHDRALPAAPPAAPEPAGS